MKILFAADVPPDPNSGAAGTEYQTMIALRNQGHTVDAIWGDDLPHRIQHGNLHYLLELPWAYRNAIRSRNSEQEYDVIHVNQPYAWLAARDHALKCRPGVFVNRSHGWETRVDEVLAPWRGLYKVPEWHFPRGVFGRPMRRMLRQYAAWCAAWADGIIVSSSEDQEYIMQKYALVEATVACIPQAPASVFVDSIPLRRLGKRLKSVLHVGTSAFVKGNYVVAEIFTALAKKCPNLRLTWCCPEVVHDQCRALLGVTARDLVKFECWMPQDKLVHVYDEHGIFLFPSFFEGFGKAPLEAMARGMVVVASCTGGMRDIIRDGETGRLIEPGQVNAFVDAIETLQLQSDQAQQMSMAAAAAARQYSWDRVASETEQFYRQLLASKLETKR